jgi:hypothetical protein
MDGEQVLSVLCCLASVTTWPANGIKVGFYAVDPTTGAPYAAGGNFYGSGGLDNRGTRSASIAAATPTSITLARTVVLTKGDILAVVLEMANTADTVSMVIPQVAAVGGAVWAQAELYTGSWASQGHGYLSFKTLGGKVPLGLFCSSFGSAGTINSGGSPNELGNQFVMPFSALVEGLVFKGTVVSGGDYQARLYVGGALAASSGTYRATWGAAAGALVKCLFSAPVWVTAGTVIQAVVKSLTVSGISIFYNQYVDSSWFASMGYPANSAYCTFNNGVFVSTAPAFLSSVGLVLRGVDDGTQLRGRRAG